jgi:uncharacterized DUF497 family protein
MDIDWDAQRKRKREIEKQNIKDTKFQTRPMGKAPVIAIDSAKAKPFTRAEIEAKAKDPANQVNVYTRPSHKRYDFDG